ncbi:hypothetical protein BGZ83_002982 [Gryganskiella cystojenkinii]|nr:hypothetical protein BGZ83_002982 [Gryganskiella cystojenkinii]
MSHQMSLESKLKRTFSLFVKKPVALINCLLGKPYPKIPTIFEEVKDAESQIPKEKRDEPLKKKVGRAPERQEYILQRTSSKSSPTKLDDLHRAFSVQSHLLTIVSKELPPLPDSPSDIHASAPSPSIPRRERKPIPDFTMTEQDITSVELLERTVLTLRSSPESHYFESTRFRSHIGPRVVQSLCQNAVVDKINSLVSYASLHIEQVQGPLTSRAQDIYNLDHNDLEDGHLHLAVRFGQMFTHPPIVRPNIRRNGSQIFKTLADIDHDGDKVPGASKATLDQISNNPTKSLPRRPIRQPELRSVESEEIYLIGSSSSCDTDYDGTRRRRRQLFHRKAVIGSRKRWSQLSASLSVPSSASTSARSFFQTHDRFMTRRSIPPPPTSDIADQSKVKNLKRASGFLPYQKYSKAEADDSEMEPWQPSVSSFSSSFALSDLLSSSLSHKSEDMFSGVCHHHGLSLTHEEPSKSSLQSKSMTPNYDACKAMTSGAHYDGFGGYYHSSPFDEDARRIITMHNLKSSVDLTLPITVPFASAFQCPVLQDTLRAWDSETETLPLDRFKNISITSPAPTPKVVDICQKGLQPLVREG